LTRKRKIRISVSQVAHGHDVAGSGEGGHVRRVRWGPGHARATLVDLILI
jgi:hypothetical protein